MSSRSPSPPRADSRARRIRSSLQQGFVADGPGFHIWEETHGETLSSARSLASALSLRQAKALRARRGPERT